MHIKTTRRRRPDVCTKRQWQNWSGFLASVGGGGKKGAFRKRYITAQLQAKHTNIPQEKLKSLFTLAEAIEAMEDGAIDSLSDILSHEFKADEMELDRNSAMAAQVRFVSARHSGLTSPGEVLMANKTTVFQDKLRKPKARPDQKAAAGKEAPERL